MVSRFRQLLADASIYGLAAVVSRFLGALLIPFYTRIFTPQDYGVLSLVTTTATILTIIAPLGLDAAALRWYWDTDDLEDRKATIASWAWCQVCLAALLGIAVVASADWLAPPMTGVQESGRALRLAGVAFALGAPTVVLVNWLRMQRRPWVTAGFTLATTFATLSLSLVLTVGLGWGLTGVFAAQIASSSVGLVLSAVLLRGWINPSRVRWGRLKPMFAYGLPLLPSSAALLIVAFSDRYLIRFLASTEEVGLYHVGYSASTVILILTAAFQQAIGPFAMSIHREPDARHVYANVLVAYVWVGCWMATGMALLAPDLLPLIATTRYAASSSVVGFLALSHVSIGIYYVASIGTTLARETRSMAIASTLGALIHVLLSLVLIPVIGIAGAAFSSLVAQLAIGAFLFYRAQQVYPIPYRFGPVAGVLLLSLVLVATTGWWHVESRIVSIAVKLGLSASFLPVLFLFGILDRAQLRRLVATLAIGRARP